MPRCYVILDGRFGCTDGVPSSHHMGYDRFGVRYTAGWDDVVLVARVTGVDDPLGSALAGPGVTVLCLPNVRGLKDLLRDVVRIVKLFWALPREASYVLRVPGIFPTLAWLVLLLRGIPYGVEMVADPADAFGPGTVRSTLRPALRLMMLALTRWQCKLAAVSAYVTQFALQRRYPPGNGRPTFCYTSLDLPAEMVLSRGRGAQALMAEPRVLINVANMQKLIKGQDVLLRALATLRAEGHNVRLILVGDGDSRGCMETLAVELGVTGAVTFAGRVQGGSAVRAWLDKGQIFVLPSRQEGLPRAMIEAMARGLPCVATHVGGSGELLDDRWLVPANDADALVAKLREMLALDAFVLAAESERNVAVARCYTRDVVQEVRIQFYNALKKLKNI